MNVYCSHTYSQLWFGWSSSGSSPSTIFLAPTSQNRFSRQWQKYKRTCRKHTGLLKHRLRTGTLLCCLSKSHSQAQSQSKKRCTIRWREVAAWNSLSCFIFKSPADDACQNVVEAPRRVLAKTPWAVHSCPFSSPLLLSLQSPSLLNSYC